MADHLNLEEACLEEAGVNFASLQETSLDVAEQSLTILNEETELFASSMVFQLACMNWAKNTAVPIHDDGLRAAVVLACYTFDMLWCGWCCLVRGFYAVAFHSVRSIDQAMVTMVAVTLDGSIAAKFWNDELDDHQAGKALQRAIEAEDARFGKEWGERRKYLRSLYHKFAHPSVTAVNPSVVIDTDQQSASPIQGGSFIHSRCVRIGRLYADLAFKAAVDVTQTFKEQLPETGPIRGEFERLVEFGRPLKARWEDEMGYR